MSKYTNFIELKPFKEHFINCSRIERKDGKPLDNSYEIGVKTIIQSYKKDLESDFNKIDKQNFMKLFDLYDVNKTKSDQVIDYTRQYGHINNYINDIYFETFRHGYPNFCIVNGEIRIDGNWLNENEHGKIILTYIDENCSFNDMFIIGDTFYCLKELYNTLILEF